MSGSQNRAIVDKLLTNVSNKIVPMGYISEEILPVINVKQTTGKLGGYGTSHLRIESDITIGKNKIPRVDTRNYTTQVYEVVKHGLSDIVTEEDVANVEAPFDAMSDTTSELTTKLWLGKERSLATTLGDTAVITQNVTLSGTDQYNDYTSANSSPLEDFNTARQSIYSSVGTPPDTAVMSWEVFNILRYHPQMLRALGYADNRPGGLSQDELAFAMDVRRLLVGTAVFESAAEGQPSAIQAVWGKNIIFCVAPQTAARGQVSLGYRIQQFGAPREVFKNAIDNPPNATEIIVLDRYQQLLSSVNAAYLIKDAVA